jgi:signal transduction histidine kinase
MRNASLHSEANQLSVAIAYGKEFSLQIRDDGKGMSPDVVDHGREGHYGLRGMRERASRIHGTLRFQSRPGAGTEVVLSVPAEIAFPPDPAPETPRLRLLKGWTNGKANPN